MFTKELECLVVQSCLTLCDTLDCSLQGSSVCGIFQAEKWSGLPFPSPKEYYSAVKNKTK